LSRLFDLSSLPSMDNRFSDASGDIFKHAVMNSDWPLDWVFADGRFNLSQCPDEKYLQFLCETIHPAVRGSETEVQQILALYNKHLTSDGFEIIPVDEISGRPIFKGVQHINGILTLVAQRTEIKKYLNTSYINGKISLMNEAIYKDTDLAIGTAKELIETECKSILKNKNIPFEKDWTIARLLKETTVTLDFTPKKATRGERAVLSIRQILSGIGTTIQGVLELRNAYGTGHGKEADFEGLEPKYAKLIVGLISEIAILYLATNGETAEVVDENDLLNLPF
jgi:hypothetical protein